MTESSGDHGHRAGHGSGRGSALGADDVDLDDHKSIGEVLTLLQSEFPDVSISKIRFLESRGLVEPDRAPSGYRKFADGDIERLRSILVMQRDHFLPLKVIKERLEEGDAADTDSDAGVGAVPAPTRVSRFRGSARDRDEFEPAEFARRAGLSAPQLDQLIRFGLLEPHDQGTGPRFSGEDLKLAKAAAAFLEHGIEARHLKAWRVAAEREAGMLEQIIVPVSRKGSRESDRRAIEVAEDLVDLGSVLRETIIVKLLRDRLGLVAD